MTKKVKTLIESKYKFDERSQIASYSGDGRNRTYKAKKRDVYSVLGSPPAQRLQITVQLSMTKEVTFLVSVRGENRTPNLHLNGNWFTASRYRTNSSLTHICFAETKKPGFAFAPPGLCFDLLCLI
jgi:hypothetical protein